MPIPEIVHDSETFETLKKAGVPDWVLPLDEIKEAPEKLFERMRSEYRDLAPSWLALFELSPDKITAADSEVINYALFFAAEFKDDRFSAALLKLLRADDDSLEFLFGDFLTVVMDECIARICSQDLEGIKALALDTSADRFARWTALDSFKALLWGNYYSAERLKEELRDVIARLEDTELWDAITSLVTNLGWVEFEKELTAASEAGYLEEALFGGEEDVRQAIENNRNQSSGEERPVFDAVTILKDYWEWSKQMAQEVAEADKMKAIKTPEGYVLDEGGGLMRDAEKVGRNDPCPCGSGKKFKKCCG